MNARDRQPDPEPDPQPGPQPGPQPDPAAGPPAYKIEVVGGLGPAGRRAFAGLGMVVDVEPVTSVLSGRLDRETLHVVLERIGALGLEVVEIRQVTAEGELPS